jgi:hypothetical protein
VLDNDEASEERQVDDPSELVSQLKRTKGCHSFSDALLEVELKRTLDVELIPQRINQLL